MGWLLWYRRGAEPVLVALSPRPYTARMTITANIEELKNGLEGFLARVEAGDELVIHNHDKPIAKVTPIPPPKKRNFGEGRGTIQILGPIDEPLIPETDWEALHGDNGLK